MPALAAGVVVDRRDHFHQPVFHRYFNAEPAKFTLGLHLHFLEGFFIHIARMRIKRRQHAVNRRLNQVGILDFLDIIAAHALEHLAEQIEHLQRVALIGISENRRGNYERSDDGQFSESPAHRVV